jgi:hypothetical protein
MLIQKGSVKTLYEAVALGTLHPRSSMFDAFELQEQLIGMPICSATEFSAVIAQDGDNRCPLAFEEWQDVLIKDVHYRDRQLRPVESGPGIARVAINDALQLDRSHPI